MNSVQYCEPCWINNKWRTVAVVEVDGELLCLRCREAAGFSAQEGRMLAPVPPVATRATPKSGVEEEMQVKTEPEARTCSHPGCTKALRRNNKAGRCKEHHYVKKGTGPGRKPKDSAARLQQLANRPDGGAKAQPVVRRHAVAEIPKPMPNGKATIAVSEAALDRFWQALTLDQKASCFSLQLETFMDSSLQAGAEAGR